MTDAATPAIVANYDKTSTPKEFKFRFKKDKLENQRATVVINGFVPSVDGIISILEKGGKGLELLQDAMTDVIRGAIASDVSEDEKYAQSTYDSAVVKYKTKEVVDGKEVETEHTLPRYSWEGIANTPRADRRASNISDEQWQDFAKDYISVMPGVTGKTEQAVTTATVVFLKKFAQVKTDKDVLNMLKGQLTLYVNNSKRAEEFSDILDLLTSKVDAYLAADDVKLLISNL